MAPCLPRSLFPPSVPPSPNRPFRACLLTSGDALSLSLSISLATQSAVEGGNSRVNTLALPLSAPPPPPPPTAAAMPTSTHIAQYSSLMGNAR